jgi:hypothetical protein
VVYQECWALFASDEVGESGGLPVRVQCQLQELEHHHRQGCQSS